MTSGEIAKKVGISQKAVRLYDEKGLLKPSDYSEGNYRLYDKEAILVLEKIIALKHIGFTLEEIYDKVCNDIYCSLERTKMVLNNKSLESACEKIANAKRIVIFGLGNSASIALDASHKLLRAGCNAFAYSDNHMQVIVASHLTEEDVVIAISHSGSSKDIVDALKLAKETGATTITITNSGKSPIQKFSDIVLFTASDETKYNILALNSRIAQLSIINAIYFYLVYHKSEKALESIKETERSLLSKKY